MLSAWLGVLENLNVHQSLVLIDTPASQMCVTFASLSYSQPEGVSTCFYWPSSDMHCYQLELLRRFNRVP